MSEFESLPQPNPSEALRIHDPNIAHIGALIMEAAMREDLGQVAEQHIERTEVENPNKNVDNKYRLGMGIGSGIK